MPEDLDGKDHRISLKVSRPGASLASYRRVLSGTRPQADTPTDPETALREALKGGPLRTGVDLRATSYVLHATTSARDLRVVAVGDVNRAAPGRAKAVAALYDFDGKPVTAMENTVDVGPDGPGALSVELTAPPGTYVLRVAVLDAEGRIGSLERLVDARWKKTGGIETPGLVLFRSDRATRSAPRPVFDGVTTADEVTAQLALSGAVADKKPHGRLRGGAGREHRAPGPPYRPHRADHRRHHGGAGDAARVDAAAGTLHAEREGRQRWRLAQPHVHRVRIGRRRPGPDRGRRNGAGRLRCAVRGVGRRWPRARRHAVVRQAAFRDVHRPRPGFVTPLIDRLAARPDTASVREAIEQSKAGPWPTDSAKGPLAQAPLAANFVAGLGRLQAGDLEEAAQAFRAALKVAPDFAPALIYLGACYAAGAKDQEAAGAWQMALVRERTSPELQRLAIEAWLRADKPAAALALLNQARQRWPEDDAFVRLQAQVALADGRQQEGVDLVATLKQPDQATLLLALNTLYDASRRKTPVWDATRDLERMRTLRESYASLQGESLALVDAWIAEMAREAGHAQR